MRARTLLVPVVAVVLAACGEAPPPGSGSEGDADQVIGAPAQRSPARPQHPARCKRLAARLEGVDLATAQASARKAGCVLRVVARDGQELAVTEDLSASRINVRVEDGTITKVAGLY
jgi:hypothetical protein